MYSLEGQGGGSLDRGTTRVLGVLYRVLGVLHGVLGVPHRVLGVPPRVAGLLHRGLGVLHRMLGLLHRVLGVAAEGCSLGILGTVHAMPEPAALVRPYTRRPLLPGAVTADPSPQAARHPDMVGVRVRITVTELKLVELEAGLSNY